MKHKIYSVLLMVMVFIGILDWMDFGNVIGYNNYRIYFRVSMYIGLFIILWLLPRKRMTVKLKFKSDFYLWAVILGVLFLLSVFLGGVLNGFGDSPYNRTLAGIGLNLLIDVLPGVVSIWLRFFIIRSVRKENRIVVAIVLTLFIALTQFSLNQLFGQSGLEEIVSFYAAYVLPEIAIQSVITYFAIMAGVGVGITYYLIVTVPFYIFKVVPNLEWLTAIFVKTLLPVFGLMVMNEIYATKSKKVKVRQKPSESSFQMMILSIISVLIVWFVVGVFPIFPNVVLTPSMTPNIMPGDVIFIQKITYDEVVLGDVLYFKKEDVHVVHRVVEIDEEQRLYQTKGDNNARPDNDLVKASQIKGVVRGKIPYVGKLILWLRRI